MVGALQDAYEWNAMAYYDFFSRYQQPYALFKDFTFFPFKLFKRHFKPHYHFWHGGNTCILL